MTHPFRLACMLLLLASPAAAQGIPRVKARILSFDGHVLVLDTGDAVVKAAPLGRPAAAPPRAAPSRNGAVPALAPADTAPIVKDRLTVTLLPATLVVAERASVPGAIRIGDFIGAEVTPGSGGRLTAKNVYIYPDALRGANEGRFADGGVTRLGGTVTALGQGSVTLHYRGLAMDNGVCSGRAASAAITPKSCGGEVSFGLGGETPVALLIAGDTRLLKEGAIATVSLVQVAGGGTATPGIIVEKPQ